MNNNILVAVLIAAAVILLIFHKVLKNVIFMIVGIAAVVVLAGFILYNLGFYFDENNISVTDGNTTFTLPEGIDTHQISKAIKLYHFVSTVDQDEMLKSVQAEYPSAVYDKESGTITVKQNDKTISIKMYQVGNFLGQDRYFYSMDIK